MFAFTPSTGLHRPAVRRLLALAAATVLSIFFLAATTAHADSSSTLTAVGTSDMSDSGLIPNFIQPVFAKAYPQFTFKYVGTATGVAITDAESGSVGASVLIVHAASLENQFVANGYSYEKYGRAIWINDFVFAGPKEDPAGVAANGAHNIAQAFADVATAGISGKATFVSRGGTPGTTVQEHQIWALVQSSGLAPSGLLLCTVSAADGGGETPIATGHGVTASGQPCPGTGLPTASQLPSWYVTTALTQGPNVIAANACTGDSHSGPNSCYVLTDRGTYDYLSSGTDPAGSIPDLTILTRDDSATAPGGADELINYFHAYIINPSKPNESVNLTAAQDFVNFITSPAIQSELKYYLPSADPGGPPFSPTASPIITAKLPRNVKAGKRTAVTGTFVNAEPDYPALAGQRVTIDQLVGGLPVPVDSGTTNSNGAFRIMFKPASTGAYELTTGQISVIENSTLNPPFGDMLSPAATAPVKVTVQGAVTSLHVKSRSGKADVFGKVAPGSGHVHGVVTVFARMVGAKRFKPVATERLSAGEPKFAVAVRLAAGTWQLKVTFKDRGRVVSGTSRVVEVTIGA
jgi:ABC-type tungstate transport system permease subunit